MTPPTPAPAAVIVLVMHGAPPSDFPRPELTRFFELHARPGHPSAGQGESPYAELERKIRSWPRTSANDPFHAASQSLASRLEAATALPVIVAFNEFCDPDLDQGLDQAVALGGAEVIVVTPMLTPGGEHAEKDIPAAIDRARSCHPGIRFTYAWPIPLEQTAAFLAAHIHRSRE